MAAILNYDPDIAFVGVRVLFIVEELVLPTPLIVFPVTPLAWLEKLGFLALNIPKLPPIGLKFWPHVEGTRRIDYKFFASGKFP